MDIPGPDSHLSTHAFNKPEGREHSTMNWYLVTGAYLLIIACVAVSGCSLLFKNPEVSVSTVSLESLSLSALNLNVTVRIDNPNPIGITFRRIAFNIYYRDGSDWNFITHGEQGTMEVKPGKTDLTIPVSVKYTDLYAAGWSILLRGELPLLVNGTASPDFFGVAPELPFTYNTTIPLKMPGP
jgi:LEA14-like dessication related protein